MLNLAKRMATCLPQSWQHSLHKSWYAWRIRRGSFIHQEPEYQRLTDWLRPGDIALDIGANIGIYTARLSRLVGERGHVYAFEPVPITFSFLTSNVDRFPIRNVTLLNVGASDASRLARMAMPLTDTGLPATALAQISDDAGTIDVHCLPIDALSLPGPVRLVKIDVEGHEFPVLKGMAALLERDQPRLIVEGQDAEIRAWLEQRGYQARVLSNSPNTIFETAQTA
ncbi:MAG: FkbM family methyltransferase [Verrucomicrobiales bacterium]